MREKIKLKKKRCFVYFFPSPFNTEKIILQIVEKLKVKSRKQRYQLKEHRIILVVKVSLGISVYFRRKTWNINKMLWVFFFSLFAISFSPFYVSTICVYQQIGILYWKPNFERCFFFIKANSYRKWLDEITYYKQNNILKNYPQNNCPSF